jgi:hypothetical protein
MCWATDKVAPGEGATENAGLILIGLETHQQLSEEMHQLGVF